MIEQRITPNTFALPLGMPAALEQLSTVKEPDLCHRLLVHISGD